MTINDNLIKDIIVNEFTILMNEIKKELRNTKNGYNGNALQDTGSAEKSLEVIVNGNIFSLIGNEYFYNLQFGRKPGKYAPVDNIKDWVRSKLGITEESEINSVAYLVNRKLYNKGTTIYEGRSLGLALEDLILNTINTIQEKIADAELVAILQENTFTYDF